ncbi:hypothetical protein [Enterobacter kobei]|uniref:hypothetical protein n=1 Tax=Enterobacter kobei TaxID=208224 RepID=UPI0039C9EF13
MSTITRERLEQLENFRGAPVTRQEEQELARIALESQGAKKIILYRERNPYNGLTTGWEELTEQEYEIVKDNASKHAEFRTVYTAPPAPVVPNESAVELLASDLMKRIDKITGERHSVATLSSLRVSIVEACRAAIFQGKESERV